MIYLRLVDLFSYMIIEHQLHNYNLCFLSEERLFSLIIDLNKTILAAFITRLVRHPEKNETKWRYNNVLFPGLWQIFLDTLYFSGR